VKLKRLFRHYGAVLSFKLATLFQIWGSAQLGRDWGKLRKWIIKRKLEGRVVADICSHMLGEFRGMTTWAERYVWGGYNNNGVWEFNQMRPSWALPMHQLKVKSNVTIFFQGHDHLFCQEAKGGVIYQEVPQPSAQTRADNPDPIIASNYTGHVLPSSGYLRIQVSPQNVSVEYVRTSPPEIPTIRQCDLRISELYLIV
jgi:hypothetical protein